MATHPKMRLRVAVESEAEPGRMHPIGMTGVLLEPLGPDTWLVEVRVPDETLEGDAWYDTLELHGHQFELIEEPRMERPSKPKSVVARSELPAWTVDPPAGEIPAMPEAERLAG